MTKTKSQLVRMVYFQVQDKITQVQGEKSDIQSSPLDCYLIALDYSRLLFDCYSIPLNQLKAAYQQKISKHKMPITCPFESQIVIFFFKYLENFIS